MSITVNGSTTLVEVAENSYTLNVETTSVDLITVGIQGPQGIQGEQGIPGTSSNRTGFVVPRGGSTPTPITSCDLTTVLGAFNVLCYGATGDGTTDDTDAFQDCLDDAGINGGIVIVPPGVYNLSSILTNPISVPNNVSLLGTYYGPMSHTGYRDTGWPTGGGSKLLLPIGGTSTYTNALITLNTNSVLQGFLLYYPLQNQSAAPPTACPPAVAMRGKNATLRYVEMLNPYWAVDVNSTPDSITERPTIEHLTGQPLYKGITCGNEGNGGIPDCARLTDIHFNPWWSYPQAGSSVPPTLFNWQQANATAFIFGDCDEVIVKTCFAYGYKVGIQFTSPNRGTYGTFAGCGLDFVRTAILCDNTQVFGVDFIGGGFVVSNGALSWLTLSNGTIGFQNCRFWGTDPGTITQTNGKLRIESCYFKTQIDINSQGTQTIVIGNMFNDASSTVELQGSAKGCVTLNNWPNGTTGDSKVSATSTSPYLITGNF